MSAQVALRGVSKKFGSSIALHPLDCSFQPGSTTVLIGPSGCGKSTLLRLVIRLVVPDTGQVEIDGEEVTSANVEKIRHRIGYVIQEGGLFPHLTARDNVLLMPRHLGRSHTEMNATLEHLCNLTRFSGELLDRYPAQLSGGQRQRISLMRALALSPDLLLLDEPLGALDPLVRAKLQEELKEIFAELRQTVVLVTHDLAEAAFLGDHLILLNEGRVVQQGTVSDLRDRPAQAFVSAFVSAQRQLLFT